MPDEGHQSVTKSSQFEEDNSLIQDGLASHSESRRKSKVCPLLSATFGRQQQRKDFIDLPFFAASCH